jgi:sulfoxide reductase catalytic subunit YedY
MNKKYKSVPVDPSEITPEAVYLSRRDILKSMGIVTASAALLAACGPNLPEIQNNGAAPTNIDNGSNNSISDENGSNNNVSSASDDSQSYDDLTDELGDPLNTFREITNYNNYYEFTTDKQGVASLARKFDPNPWSLEIDGLVNNPLSLSLDDLLSQFTQEDRIYRLRCVEAWSMVIPWQGFELGKLLEMVEPTAEAKYVRFETIYDPDQMPGQKQGFYPWPYQEGLRLDEAMNSLTILATGLYGKPMPNQSGSPIRLVVPWKYGFKSIKAITRIELVAEEPETMWSTIAPREYGFYANVNPEVDHPRWLQSSERRIGEFGQRETLMFNGYAEEVAYLYEGMDLEVNY